MVKTFVKLWKATFCVTSPKQGEVFLQTKGKSILFPLTCDLRALRINKVSVFCVKSICTSSQSDEDSSFNPDCTSEPTGKVASAPHSLMSTQSPAAPVKTADSDSVGLGRGLRFSMSNKPPGCLLKPMPLIHEPHFE